MRGSSLALGLGMAAALGAGVGAFVTMGEQARADAALVSLGGPAPRREAPAPPVALPHGARLRVILDAGHGGSNTGCAGVIEGVYEKRFTLALSQLVAERLRARGIDVVMTREDDRYLTLRERVRLANQSGADVFVSLHANASPGRAQRGFETWVLTPEAMSVDARAIRAGDGPPRPGVPDDVAAVLDDVERNAAQPWSLRLATRVQAHLGEVWGPERSRGVRQGAQDVLMGLTMPGVLVEVGFLDHPVEGAALLQGETRERLADAVAAAIAEWAEERAKDPR